MSGGFAGRNIAIMTTDAAPAHLIVVHTAGRHRRPGYRIQMATPAIVAGGDVGCRFRRRANPRRVAQHTIPAADTVREIGGDECSRAMTNVAFFLRGNMVQRLSRCGGQQGWELTRMAGTATA